MWQLIVEGVTLLVKADRVWMEEAGRTSTDIYVLRGEEDYIHFWALTTRDVRIIPPAVHKLEPVFHPDPVFPTQSEHPAQDYLLRVA